MSCIFVQWQPRCSVQTDRRVEGRTDRHDEANSPFSQFYKISYNLDSGQCFKKKKIVSVR